MKEFAGKRVLVTGAAKGIGRGIARSFAEAGADLLLHYRSDPAEAEELRAELSEYASSVHLFRCDLGTEEGIDALFAEAERLFGGLDTAVNNAGWDPGFVALDTIDYALYRKLTDMNIKGTLFCCLNEIRLMRKSGGGGSIINIGSVQMETTVPGRTLYAMSKGAIHSLTGELALEAGPEGIRVNCIAPGYIAVKRMCSSPGFDEAEIASGIPVRRIGVPGDIGACALFLASEKASFINGQTVIVDGGVSRKLARGSR